jgi:hypothetical protein
MYSDKIMTLMEIEINYSLVIPSRSAFAFCSSMDAFDMHSCLYTIYLLRLGSNIESKNCYHV